jgi:hypothetical protein
MATSVVGRDHQAKTIGRRRILARADRFLTDWRMLVAAGVLYLGYALFVTWPLATNLSGQLSAPNLLEDAAGTASYFGYLVGHHMSPFLAGHLSGLNAPYGVRETWALNLAQAPSYLIFWLLALAFGAVAGANLFMLVGFVASGVTMYAVAERVFGSRAAALLAGFAYAFYPFAIAAASVHYAFVHSWPLLLCVWRLIEMTHQPSDRNALLAGVATAFAMWWNPYYELIGGFTLATMIVIAMSAGVRRGDVRHTIRAVAIALIPVAALGLFFLILLKAGGGLSEVGTIKRPLSQVYSYSAHMRDYLLPSPNNLLFGRLTGDYLNARLGYSNSWETAIYPGYVVITLASLGFARSMRLILRGRATLSDVRILAVVAAGTLAGVAFISSGPPSVSVAGLSIPLPSGILFRITPTWQTFSRFVILLELSLCLMMAAEVAHLSRRFEGRRVGLVMALIAMLLVVDLWARPAHRTVSTAPSPAYAWLRAHPGGTVAEYPLLPGMAPANASGFFWQAYDGHPLLEGYAPGSSIESEKLDLADLSGPLTAAKLASYGVRYIVVHGGTPGGSAAQLRGRGYRLIIGDRRHGSLWRVTAGAAHTTVDAGSGFDWARGFPSYDRRLLHGHGVLTVTARDCSSCSGTVSFSLDGIGRATALTVRDGRSGVVLATLAVPPRRRNAPVSISGVTLHAGHGSLDLQTTPRRGAVSIGLRTATFTPSGR